VWLDFVLCNEYAGGDQKLISSLLLQPPMRLLIPLCCVVQPNKKLLRVCRQGILQYALLRPLVSVVTLILLILGLYNEGEWRTDRGYLYATIINNIGVTISLYCLALFYKAAKEDLRPFKPILKFACIKLVVFFCYWQSVLLAIILAFEVVPNTQGLSSGQLATAAQNLLICFEMFIFSIMHFYAFPYDVYKINALVQAPLIHEVELGGTGVIKGIAHSVNQSDMLSDTFQSFVPKGFRESLQSKKEEKRDDTVELSDLRSHQGAKQRKGMEKKGILEHDELAQMDSDFKNSQPPDQSIMNNNSNNQQNNNHQHPEDEETVVPDDRSDTRELRR